MLRSARSVLVVSGPASLDPYQSFQDRHNSAHGITRMPLTSGKKM